MGARDKSNLTHGEYHIESPYTLDKNPDLVSKRQLEERRDKEEKKST